MFLYTQIVFLQVIEMLLLLRSDSLHRLGLVDRGSDTQFAYSHSIVCKERYATSIYLYTFGDSCQYCPEALLNMN